MGVLRMVSPGPVWSQSCLMARLDWTGRGGGEAWTALRSHKDSFQPKEMHLSDICQSSWKSLSPKVSRPQPAQTLALALVEELHTLRRQCGEARGIGAGSELL